MRKIHTETLSELREVVEKGEINKLRKNIREYEPKKKSIFNPTNVFKKLIKKYI